MADSYSVRMLGEAQRKLQSLGLGAEQAHALAVAAREERMMTDHEVATRDVIVGGEKVAVVYAWSDGELEVREPDPHPCLLGRRL
jgi:hypothetical protein